MEVAYESKDTIQLDQILSKKLKFLSVIEGVVL